MAASYPDDEADLRRRNREAVEKYMSLNGQDRAGRADLFADDCVAGLKTTGSGVPEASHGIEEYRQACENQVKHFPDWSFEDFEIFETQFPDKFWVTSGGFGHIEFPGYPRTEYRNDHIHYFEVRDGKIAVYWEYMNPCIEMHALGLPVPEVKKPDFL
jgi:phenazine biosynthesis protein